MAVFTLSLAPKSHAAVPAFWSQRLKLRNYANYRSFLPFVFLIPRIHRRTYRELILKGLGHSVVSVVFVVFG